MNDYFLIEQLIFEGKLEELKKKYNKVPENVIEDLSKEDPSGTNKYLEFLVQNYSEKSPSFNLLMVNLIKNFHQNLQKIDTNLLDDVYSEERLIDYLDPSETSPLGKTVKKIYKAPKDINSYFGTGGSTILEKIVAAAKQKLSKSQVKELDVNVLYDSSKLKILIPKSYQASCYYGSGTKWCTTNKKSDSHYKKYTNEGTLFYIIDKTSSKENNWYKTAIFVDGYSGSATAFDAPDNPKSIEEASKALATNWMTIRDVLVDYLYKINSKGIDNFFYGRELITWFNSKGINPVRVLTPKELLNRLGFDTTVEYLKEININAYEYLDFYDIFSTLKKEFNNKNSVIIAEIWEKYKKSGINPLNKMFKKRSNAQLVVEAVEEGDVSLDDFLYYINDSELLSYFGENQNLFTFLSRLFGETTFLSSQTGDVLKRLFKNNSNLMWGYIKNFNINIFKDLDAEGVYDIIRDRFTVEEALDFIFENIESIDYRLIRLGYDNKTIIKYLKSKDKLHLIDLLLEKKLLQKMSIEDDIELGRDPKESLKYFYELEVYDGESAADFVDYLLRSKDSIKTIFPSFQDLLDFISNNDINNRMFRKLSENTKKIVNVFFDGDYYLMYVAFLDAGKELNLSDMIIAYEHSPVNDKTNLKEKILSGISELFESNSPTRICKLVREGDKFYIYLNDLKILTNFFIEADGDVNDNIGKILSGDAKSLMEYFPDFDYSLLYNNEFRETVNDFLMLYRNKRVVIGLEFLDDFEFWAESVDEGNGTFYFILSDEIIYSLNPELLEILLINAPLLSDFNKFLKKSNELAYKNYFSKNIFEYVIDTLSGTIGGKYLGYKKTDKFNIEKHIFEYPLFLEDCANYVIEGHDITILNSPCRLIIKSMDRKIGRFKEGPIPFDFENEYEDFFPDEEQLIDFIGQKIIEKINSLEF